MNVANKPCLQHYCNFVEMSEILVTPLYSGIKLLRRRIVVFIRVLSRRLFGVEMHTAIAVFFYVVVVVAVCLL